MADDGAAFISRPGALVRASRYFFVSPGEPRDFKTLETLVSAALAECSDRLLTDRRAATLLAAIGKSGRDGLVVALESRVADMVSATLHNPKTRQRVRHAAVTYCAVPQPRKGRVFGVVRVYAWRHVLRSTFDLDLGTHK